MTADCCVADSGDTGLRPMYLHSTRFIAVLDQLDFLGRWHFQDTPQLNVQLTVWQRIDIEQNENKLQKACVCLEISRGCKVRLLMTASATHLRLLFIYTRVVAWVARDGRAFVGCGNSLGLA